MSEFTRRACLLVCCGEGRQLHPISQLESPLVPRTGWPGRRAVGPTAICFTFAMFAGTFRRQKNIPYADQFFDPRWLARLDLLMDITTQLNALNVKLQGKYILVTDMHAHITAFEVNLGLWEAQSANGQLEHFHRLAACVPDDVEPDTCVSVVASLRKEFASRFAGVRPLAADFKLCTATFDFPVDDAPAPCRWSWWSYCAMMNWKRSFITLLHSPSSATSCSLLGIFLNTLRMFNAS